MKRNLISIVIFFFSFFASVCAIAAGETYQIDPQHSFVQWSVNHLGFSNQTGKWPIYGTVTFNQQDPQNSRVQASVIIKEMITGIPELNKHLSELAFFDVKKFKTARFMSTQISVTGKNTAKIVGILTLRGVSKHITLNNVTLNKKGENPVNGKMSVGFSATTEITRSEFGIGGFLPFVGDKVKLTIDLEANLLKANQ